MHCAETVVSMLNDEEEWQYVVAKYGQKPYLFAPRRYWPRWRSIALFVVKSSVQWVFAFAVSVDTIFAASFLPILVVTVLFLAVAIALEIMCRWKPDSKSAPSAYGELDLLFRYITRHYLVSLSSDEFR